MKPVEMLLIEDNPADVLLLSEALLQCGWDSLVTVARDGQEALDLLAAKGSRPDLILMDLNMPNRSGPEVLAELKADPALAAIPVIILSGSRWDQGLAHTFGLPEQCYLVKPNSFQGYLETARRLQSIWRNR